MPHQLTATEAASRIRNRELTAIELVQTCLDRIAKLDPDLYAWVAVDTDAALSVAEILDAEADSGNLRGPLHGIPVGIKDIIDALGFATEAGSAFLRGNRPEQDATVVGRLRAAGAIILGKTATTEFACFDPAATRNPWNTDHTPGGSSSGTAAAVASSMVPAAIGTQTGGSISRPAAYCGVVGFKPTFGRVSRHGVFPVSHTLDHVGPLARTVSDAALFYSVMHGHDVHDPFSSSRRIDNARIDDTRFATTPPRLGLVRSWFMEAADEATCSAVEDATGILAEGCRIPTVRLPKSFKHVHQKHRLIMYADLAAIHETRFSRQPEKFRPGIHGMIEEGLLLPAVAYAEARHHQTIFKRELHAAFQDVDVLITPATPTPAPAGLESTGDPAFNAPWSYAGFPTVVLPAAVTQAGLPVGLQLVGRPFAEPELLAAAAWCEERLAFSAVPPLAS